MRDIAISIIINPSLRIHILSPTISLAIHSCHAINRNHRRKHVERYIKISRKTVRYNVTEGCQSPKNRDLTSSKLL